MEKKENHSRQNIAGMSMKGGRKDNFYFCLFEYFPDGERWFLRSLLQVKDEEGLEGDDAIRGWIGQYEIRQLVLDFPLSPPPCHTCKLDCPGVQNCPVPSVAEIKSHIDQLLIEDSEKLLQNPKQYEYDRNNDDMHFIGRDWPSKVPTHHILSRSFKRRLKRGLLPYWNRPIDYIIWTYYYDALLKIFNQTYDSFGNTSLVIISRFSYLQRHFPRSLQLFEGHVLLTLIELVRAKVIKQTVLLNLSDIEQGKNARSEVIKAIERSLNLFIYEHDLDILVKQPRAFESFIMAISGICFQQNKIRSIPSWIGPESSNFIIPAF